VRRRLRAEPGPWRHLRECPACLDRAGDPGSQPAQAASTTVCELRLARRSPPHRGLAPGRTTPGTSGRHRRPHRSGQRRGRLRRACRARPAGRHRRHDEVRRRSRRTRHRRSHRDQLQLCAACVRRAPRTGCRRPRRRAHRRAADHPHHPGASARCLEPGAGRPRRRQDCHHVVSQPRRPATSATHTLMPTTKEDRGVSSTTLRSGWDPARRVSQPAAQFPPANGQGVVTLWQQNASCAGCAVCASPRHRPPVARAAGCRTRARISTTGADTMPPGECLGVLAGNWRVAGTAAWRLILYGAKSPVQSRRPGWQRR
jgi:hypothetical protein